MTVEIAWKKCRSFLCAVLDFGFKAFFLCLKFLTFSSIKILQYLHNPGTRKGVYRYILMTYFTVIQTKANIFHVSTLPEPVCDKTTAKKRWSLPKTVSFWTSKQLFTLQTSLHFLPATCHVCTQRNYLERTSDSVCIKPENNELPLLRTIIEHWSATSAGMIEKVTRENPSHWKRPGSQIVLKKSGIFFQIVSSCLEKIPIIFI